MVPYMVPLCHRWLPQIKIKLSVYTYTGLCTFTSLVDGHSGPPGCLSSQNPACVQVYNVCVCINVCVYLCVCVCVGMCLCV